MTAHLSTMCLEMISTGQKIKTAQHGIEYLPTAETEDIPAVTVEQPQINLTLQQMVSHAIDYFTYLKTKFQICSSEIANLLANYCCRLVLLRMSLFCNILICKQFNYNNALLKN